MRQAVLLQLQVRLPWLQRFEWLRPRVERLEIQRAAQVQMLPPGLPRKPIDQRSAKAQELAFEVQAERHWAFRSAQKNRCLLPVVPVLEQEAVEVAVLAPPVTQVA